MSTQITAQMVKELRERTGAPMMDCKAALTETGGDADKAVEVLRLLGLADLLVGQERGEEALELLERIPETAEVRRVAALARTGAGADNGDVEARLEQLLGQVKADPAARQEFVDLLEIMGTDDPRTSVYRRRLTTQLY